MNNRYKTVIKWFHNHNPNDIDNTSSTSESSMSTIGKTTTATDSTIETSTTATGKPILSTTSEGQGSTTSKITTSNSSGSCLTYFSSSSLSIALSFFLLIRSM